MKNLAKLRKSLDKKGYHIGFAPIPDWICTGNAGLNNIITGDMLKGIPVGRSSVISGLQGAGKSFIISNIAKNAQKKGYFVVFIDTEYSVGEGFMEKIGVDLDENKFMPVNVHTYEELVGFLSELWKTTEKDDKILICLDSMSMITTESNLNKNSDGKIAYDQGLPQKIAKQVVSNINGRIGDRNVAFVMTSHLFINGADNYGNPILKPNIGEGTLYVPSVGIELTKAPLREGKELTGISVRCKTFKTRYNQLGKKCEFSLPWDRGMDFLDGSLEILEEAGIVEANGGWKSYADRETGEVIKFQKSSYHEHSEKLMQYYSDDAGEIEEKDEADANIEMIEAK